MNASASPVGPWLDSYIERILTHPANGFHASSPWWSGHIDRIRAERPSVVVARAGRRAGKTVHCCRWLLGEIYERHWDIDPGDVGVVPIISAHRWQALDRIDTLRQYIEAIAPDSIVNPQRPRADRIDLIAPWGRCSIRASTASSAGVVGSTNIAAVLDEVARWIDNRGRNPAKEVIASLKPTLLSTGGTMWMLSSPMGMVDAHAREFALGNTPGYRYVFHGETWVANPTITKAATQFLEPDELIWQREYAAIPMAIDGYTWLNWLLLDRAVDNGRSPFESIATRVGGDLAFLRDAAAAVATGFNAQGRTNILALKEWRPIHRPLAPSEVITEAYQMALDAGGHAIMSDVHGRASMLEHARGRNVGYLRAPTDGRQWMHMRSRLQHDRMALPSCATHCACGGKGICDRLVNQLRHVRIRPTTESLTRIHETDNAAHGDLAEAAALGEWQHRSYRSIEQETIGANSTWGRSPGLR